MAESKRHDWGLIVAGVLLVLLAIFITAFPGLTLATITAILGAGFLVSGILDLVGYVRLKGNLFTSPSPWMIVYAVLDIIIGIMLLLHPIVFAGVVSWLVGIFVVAFGVIEVVYRPLQRIFHIGADALTAAGEALTAMGISFTTVTRDTNIIAQVIAGESTVSSCFTPDQVATITEFGQHMDFFGIDLTRVPQYSLAAENLPLLILPVLAIVTMFLSTHISMKASGQEMQGSMKLTMYMMPLMYVFFCFTVPSAFSLYYVVSNILMTVQSLLMKKIYDPEKMKAEVAAEMAARKKEQKRGVKSTTIKVQDEKTGEVVEKNISASEMNKRRLEYARQQDAERYKDERTVPLSELQNKKED